MVHKADGQPHRGDSGHKQSDAVQRENTHLGLWQTASRHQHGDRESNCSKDDEKEPDICGEFPTRAQFVFGVEEDRH